jgi:hypothetical protein
LLKIAAKPRLAAQGPSVYPKATKLGGEHMAQRLHLVFGGELVNPQTNVFRDVKDIHIVGMFPDYDSAFLAWKAEAQRTVDNAHMRYFIAHIHRLREEGKSGSLTEEMGA